MLKKYRDSVVAVCIMIIAVILFISTFSIRSLLGMNPGPDFMPKVASVLLFLDALGMFVEGLETAKGYVPETIDEQEAAYRKAGNRKVLYSVLLIGFYVYSLRTLGFVISSTIYSFCQMIVLTPYGKKKNYVLFAIISFAFALFIFLVFTKVLYLMLPAGLMSYIGF